MPENFENKQEKTANQETVSDLQRKFIDTEEYSNITDRLLNSDPSKLGSPLMELNNFFSRLPEFKKPEAADHDAFNEAKVAIHNTVTNLHDAFAAADNSPEDVQAMLNTFWKENKKIITIVDQLT